ncbi:MAG: hypothetical protein JST69_10625 [Bacteroidetes bacterium]|nr:hypothetical protein [Bacteroidota bacterium]
MANESDDIQKNQQDEENFGLPEIEYKPLDQLEEKKTEETTGEEHEEPREEEFHQDEHAQQKPEDVYEFEEETTSSKAPLVIGIIIALVVGVAGFMIYKFVYLPKKAKQEQLAKDKAEAERKAEADRKAKEAEELRLKQEAEAKANAKPADGTIETLAQRTGHYFVIVSSSIDGDLAMDRAKILSAKGISSKIIPPFGKWKYYRLGIGDFDSYASAQSSADASKTEYGNTLWVMKY